ncbi:MAG: 4-hydroxy-tetrahydrodipicolinate reductase [Acidobacteria bacterium]|nr:4-hydroxy-tetrahydrodipicolinate reductase [Acidobacteriota bacterium]
MIVGVSGAAGRMGTLVAETIEATDDLDLGPLFDPKHAGSTIAGATVEGSRQIMADADVVVEFTLPDVVVGNLDVWQRLGLHCVVGTSGFDADRIAQVTERWGSGPPNCLIVPNFSIGAVVTMQLAEIAAPHFAAAEVIELHHDRKADAPSGTAIATAERIAAAATQHRHTDSAELVAGARGADVSGVPVHAIRLPGIVADQIVILGGTGETITIRHTTTDRTAFIPGVLAAIRGVAGLENPVTVGLEAVLEKRIT